MSHRSLRWRVVGCQYGNIFYSDDSGYTAYEERKGIDIMSPSLAAALNLMQISDENATYLFVAVINALELDPDYNITTLVDQPFFEAVYLYCRKLPVKFGKTCRQLYS